MQTENGAFLRFVSIYLALPVEKKRRLAFKGGKAEDDHLNSSAGGYWHLSR